MALAWAAGAVSPAFAGDAVRLERETRIRAAMLFHLAQFTYWPEPPADVVRFCVVGDDTLPEPLAHAVRGRTIAGRRIEVTRAENGEPLDACEVAYIGHTREREIREFFSHWDYPPVLLVGEAERFTELGGMVNLVIGPGRVAFEVNLVHLHRAGLELRSQLLRFVRLVVPPPEQPRLPPGRKGP